MIIKCNICNTIEIQEKLADCVCSKCWLKLKQNLKTYCNMINIKCETYESCSYCRKQNIKTIKKIIKLHDIP